MRRDSGGVGCAVPRDWQSGGVVTVPVDLLGRRCTPLTSLQRDGILVADDHGYAVVR